MQLPTLKTPNMDPMKPFETVYMRLCFHVIRSFLPSLPGGRRHATRISESSHCPAGLCSHQASRLLTVHSGSPRRRAGVGPGAPPSASAARRRCGHRRRLRLTAVPAERRGSPGAGPGRARRTGWLAPPPTTRCGTCAGHTRWRARTRDCTGASSSSSPPPPHVIFTFFFSPPLGGQGSAL